jgi:hypothetical protein
MRLLKQTSRVRLIAMVACLSAVAVYWSFNPIPAYACEESGCCTCVSGGVEYSDGDCKGKAECRCTYEGTTCTGCSWLQGSANCNLAD